MALIECFECKNRISRYMRICPTCGKKQLSCPQCRKPYHPQEEFCSRCGCIVVVSSILTKSQLIMGFLVFSVLALLCYFVARNATPSSPVTAPHGRVVTLTQPPLSVGMKRHLTVPHYRSLTYAYSRIHLEETEIARLPTLIITALDKGITIIEVVDLHGNTFIYHIPIR